jgi:phospholipid transport system substrate-binding protein
MNKNISRRSVVFGAAAGFVLLKAAPLLAQVTDPAARRIQTYYSTLLPAVLQTQGMSVGERARRISPAVLGIFDIGLMVRLAVGPSWSRFSGAQQGALREAFASFTVADYASQLGDYSGENAVVDPVVETRGGDRLVKTRIGSTQINYLVRGSRVVDVYANGTVSELANRRAEFSSILASGTPDTLIQTLRQRTHALIGG